MQAVAGFDWVLHRAWSPVVSHDTRPDRSALLDLAAPGARLVFSCGCAISRVRQDVDARGRKWKVAVLAVPHARPGGPTWTTRSKLPRVLRQRYAWVGPSSRRGSKKAKAGLPGVWIRHVGDPILASNITRRVDFALFMVRPCILRSDHEAPAIVAADPSALAPPRYHRPAGPLRIPRSPPPGPS